MILVTVGTNGAAFDRLLSQLDDVASDEEVVIQRGPSRLAPSGSFCVDYLPFSEIDRLVGAARVVITHGGVGSTLVSIGHGHRPLVVPRLRAFGEAVDDHQLSFVERLDRDGLVRCIVDPARIREELAAGTTRLPEREGLGNSPLVAELASYLALRSSLRKAPVRPSATSESAEAFGAATTRR
jgi:UDP-N-acetylglucosamine transferase subunit ALG13